MLCDNAGEKSLIQAIKRDFR